MLALALLSALQHAPTGSTRGRSLRGLGTLGQAGLLGSTSDLIGALLQQEEDDHCDDRERDENVERRHGARLRSRRVIALRRQRGGL